MDLSTSRSPQGCDFSVACAWHLVSIRGPIHPLVLSQHYWPPALSKADHPRFRPLGQKSSMQPEIFSETNATKVVFVCMQSPRLPAQLEDALSEYGHAYTKTKAKRRLSWAKRHTVPQVSRRRSQPQQGQARRRSHWLLLRSVNGVE